jgi:hypothetical protein
MWVKRELEFVLDERRLADKILPLLYQACDYKRFSWALSSSQMHVGIRLQATVMYLSTIT